MWCVQAALWQFQAIRSSHRQQAGKKKATYILDTTHYWMMLKSPNSHDFADNGLSLGKLCKRWQTANKTHITCGYTKELPKESTNLGSDMTLYYQTGKSPDCSTWMEGFGTKTRSRCGIPNERICNDVPIRTRNVWRRYKRVEKIINTTHWTTNWWILKRYIFWTRIQKLSIYLSQCKSQKMIFVNALLSLHFSHTMWTN